MVRYWRTCAMVLPSSRKPTRAASTNAQVRAALLLAARARISGIVNTSHQTATVTNDTLHRLRRVRQAEQRRFADHEHVDEEQQAAAEIAQRVAERRDAVELRRASPRRAAANR